MKRVYYSLIILTLCIVNTSCGWYYKTFGDVESYTEWYCEEMYKAVKEDNLEAVVDLTYNTGEWFDTLSEEDKKDFKTAGRNWRDKNPFKHEVVDEYLRKHRDEIPK